MKSSNSCEKLNKNHLQKIIIKLEINLFSYYILIDQFLLSSKLYLPFTSCCCTLIYRMKIWYQAFIKNLLKFSKWYLAIIVMIEALEYRLNFILSDWSFNSFEHLPHFINVQMMIWRFIILIWILNFTK